MLIANRNRQGKYVRRASTATCLALASCAAWNNVVIDAAAQSASSPTRDQLKSAQPNVADRRGRTGNLVGHGGPIKAIRVDAQSGRVLTGAFDYAVMLWDITGSEPRVIHRLDQHGGPVNAVAFVPNSNRAIGSIRPGGI